MEDSVKEDKKFCECGCGELMDAFWYDPRGGRKPVPRRFIRGHNHRGERNNKWKGGRMISGQGYIQIRKPDHPFSGTNGYVFEHRLVWEEYNNAILLPWVIIHHINENRKDNRIENLEVNTRRNHNFIHKPRKDMSDRICFLCGKNTTPTYHKNGMVYFGWYKHGREWICRNCYRNSRR